MLLLRSQLNNITCKRIYGNPKTWIWQPLWPNTFQNHHIDLCLLLYNISEGSYTTKKPATLKLWKIQGKTAENRKNAEFSENTAVVVLAILSFDFSVSKMVSWKKIIILDLIEKKLVALPMAMAAILDFGLWRLNAEKKLAGTSFILNLLSKRLQKTWWGQFRGGGARGPYLMTLLFKQRPKLQQKHWFSFYNYKQWYAFAL